MDMKSKLFNTLLTGALTCGMALGGGTSLGAQDSSMDKPSPDVTGAVAQPVPEQAPQYNAQPQYSSPQSDSPQYNAPGPSAPQDAAPPQYPDQGQEQAPPPAAAGPNQRQYSPLPADQLNKLAAPIALYPDSLVAQILAGSAYPTQIVEANRFLKENPDLKGKELGDAIDQQDWDPSVKALCQFPSVLANMDRNLTWTSALGDANYNQPNDVMQAIQYMRHKAYDSGNLRTTPQQRVYEQGPDVDIQPADPNVVYVPTYNPAYVYGYPVGLWPGFYPWWGYGFGGPYVSFGLGFPIWPFFGFGWGWHGWGIGWGFHGGILFGGHPYGFHSGAFYAHNAFVHGNYSGYGRGGVGARGSAGRGSAGNRGYAGASHSSAGGNRGYAGANRGSAGNRSYAGNRGYAGNRSYGGTSRGFSGSANRGYAGHSATAPRSGGFSGSRGAQSHGFSGGSHGGGGHASSGHSSGGGHSGGGHGGGGHR
jgi:hypothetical protein